MDPKSQELQALLYAHGGEIRKEELVSLLAISEQDLANRIESLRTHIEGQGIEIVESPATISLRTAQAYADRVADLQRKSNEKDIGTAGLEVIAIVLYKGGASRATIDYIRGVNSSGTLRQLVLRGLLERQRDTKDARAWVYTVTAELLAHIGVSSLAELPDYETIASSLEQSEDVEETHHE